MKCPFCGKSDSAVLDTRISDDSETIRRRRRCQVCERRFTTYERAEIQLPQVIKKNGGRVPFVRDKLRASLELALRKRPVTMETIDTAVTGIEEKLLALGDREVTTQHLGELVMFELRRLDKVAYIRFASVYRNFEDVDAFSRVIREVAPDEIQAQTR
ncbi:MAG: transcriptional regulator NrdR [Zoogloeaceae bacterium]|jgi:transcriptional repressor NrdR|nr:transcriptional regulator NrdR [Zoogloeaceae bacterium]